MSIARYVYTHRLRTGVSCATPPTCRSSRCGGPARAKTYTSWPLFAGFSFPRQEDLQLVVPGTVARAATVSNCCPATRRELAVGLRHHLIGKGLAASTLRVYGAGLSQYLAFCREVGAPHPFPLPEYTLELFVALRGVHLSAAALKVYLALSCAASNAPRALGLWQDDLYQRYVQLPDKYVFRAQLHLLKLAV